MAFHFAPANEFGTQIVNIKSFENFGSVARMKFPPRRAGRARVKFKD